MVSQASSKYYAGAVFWMLSLQYYVVQIIAAADWSPLPGFNWLRNTISDLGNTKCGQYGGKLVCSPLHNYMNASFITLGVTMILGAVLLQSKAQQLPARLGFGCLGSAGVGTIIVGLFPENTVSNAHIFGAALPFILGNVGMLLVGWYFRTVPTWLRNYTLLSGLIGLIALVLFRFHFYLGLDIGGMERLVAYPQSIWMVVYGVFVITQRFRPSPASA